MIYAFPANQWRVFCKRHSASLIFIMIAQLRGLHLRNASRLCFAVALSFPLLRLSMSSTCRWALCVWVCCEDVYNRFTTPVIVLQRSLGDLSHQASQLIRQQVSQQRIFKSSGELFVS